MRERLNKQFKKFKNQKGFTLVELMAVLAIIGLVLAIAIPAIGNIINKSELRADDASIGMIERGAELAYLDEFNPEKDGKPERNVSYTIEQLIDGNYVDLDENHKWYDSDVEVERNDDSGKFVLDKGGLDDYRGNTEDTD